MWFVDYFIDGIVRCPLGCCQCICVLQYRYFIVKLSPMMNLKLLSSRKRIWLLLILDVAMSLTALAVDLHDFFETPWYLWLWVPVCSVYPFLLALNYGIFLWRGRFPAFLLGFTVFGVLGYGVIAPVFYLLYMRESGFAWYELGNIFWVWLYACQGLLLWPYVRDIYARGVGLHARTVYLLIIASYFFTKDVLDRFSITWSYVRFGVLSEQMMNVTFVVLLLVHAFLLHLFFRTLSSR